mgnify:CR=1 FL=1
MERAAALVRYAASLRPKDELYPKAAAPAYAARLLLNVDTNYALTKLDAAVSSRLEMARKKLVANPLNPPGLDPFDKVVLVHTYFLSKDKIPKATALKIRDYCALYAHKIWKGYGAMNYRLMMDGADQIISGIGSHSTPDTLLYGTAQIKGGLEEMKAGLGSPTTPDTLLYAVVQIKGGLELLKEGIGSASTPDTLLYAVDQVQKGLNIMKSGIGSPVSEDTLLYAVAQVEMGLELMKAGIGSSTSTDTLLYAMSAMRSGLNEMKSGIGSSSTANTLLYAVAQVQNGLELMKSGIGDSGVPDTLLYAMAQVQGGLHRVKNGLSSGDMNEPGIKEGLVMISAGLGDAVAGLGSTSTPDTLLYGADQVNGGVEQVKEGLERATQEGTSVMYAGLTDSLADLYLTQSELEAIKVRGENFDHILGRVPDAKANKLTFIYQTPATYNYKRGSNMNLLVGLVLSIVSAVAIMALSVILKRRPVIG